MKKGATYVTQPMLTLNAIDGNVVSRMLATDRWEKRAGSGTPKRAAPGDFLQRSGHLGNIRPEILDRQLGQCSVSVQLCQCLIDSGQQRCRVGALATGMATCSTSSE